MVTGASSGIGAAVANALVASGARVVGLARRFETRRLLRAPDAGQMSEIRLDVTDEAAVAQCFTDIERLSGNSGLGVLVNAAGSGTFSPVIELGAADLDTMLAVHIKGSFLCSRAAVNAMIPRRRGHIAFISSVAASRSFANCAGYAAAKAGQLAFARGLAEEARQYGITVNSLILGAVDTPIWDKRAGFDRERMMRADDVAALLVSILERPGVAVEELSIVPPGGHL